MLFIQALCNALPSDDVDQHIRGLSPTRSQVGKYMPIIWEWMLEISDQDKFAQSLAVRDTSTTLHILVHALPASGNLVPVGMALLVKSHWEICRMLT